MNADSVGYIQTNGCIIQDGSDARLYQFICRGLRGGGGNGQHGDFYIRIANAFHHIDGIFNHKFADAFSDFGRVVIEKHHDAEAPIGEALKVGQRMSKFACTNHSYIPQPVNFEYLTQFVNQKGDGIARTLFSKFAELGNIRRIEDPTDRRIVRLALTDKGKVSLEQGLKDLAKMIKKMLVKDEQ